MEEIMNCPECVSDNLPPHMQKHLLMGGIVALECIMDKLDDHYLEEVEMRTRAESLINGSIEELRRKHNLLVAKISLAIDELG